MLTNKHDIVRKITNRARSWVGTPFQHQGRSKEGCDCIAPTLDITQMLKMENIQDWPKYGRLPAGPRLYKTAQKNLIEINKNSYQPGDVVFMTWGKHDPHHIAIIVTMADGNIGIIHSSSQIGKVVEHILDPRWKKKIVCAFRFPIIDKLNKEEK